VLNASEWLLIALLGSQARRFLPPFISLSMSLSYSKNVVGTTSASEHVLVSEHKVEDHLVGADDES